jgi:hypothetical protein
MELRSSRAKIGTLTTPMAIMTAVRPRPIAAATPIARSRLGMASIMSMNRMITVSTRPPRAPAVPPNTSPTNAPNSSDASPMTSEVRAP